MCIGQSRGPVMSQTPEGQVRQRGLRMEKCGGENLIPH